MNLAGAHPVRDPLPARLPQASFAHGARSCINGYGP
jgi:hypothetical protein